MVKDAPFLNFVLAVVLVLALGWLLVIGKFILLPLASATILALMIHAATEALSRLPLIGRLPAFALRLGLLAAFALVVLLLYAVVASTVDDIVLRTPAYEENLRDIVSRIAAYFHIESGEAWQAIREATIDEIDLRQLALSVLGALTSTGVAVLITMVFTIFLLSERQSLAEKLAVAMRDRNNAERSFEALASVRERVSRYLLVKTCINVLIAVISYVIMRSFELDFALFWALMIGLFNYIPYVGSIVAVAFPVLLSVVQFGELGTTLLLAAVMTVAQILVGNIIEPQVIGRQLNQSPIVVVCALAVWGAIWGIPGAILAVPMTASLAIVLHAFPATRPVSILLAERIDDPRATGLIVRP
ncbi:AI-2E family transporter [Pseudooceanicola nanhaiensis]|jgi:predicted PurR-regulated permease PerM|uniref:AI-2E family transporter n=2 Tax=Pseudooceanicola nanhaiensis TaxID=375761 RepID=A0A917WCS4_9RHOB|nr:AI-2E family transporter [Pseudooceanicola nanhaiensis]